VPQGRLGGDPSHGRDLADGRRVARQQRHLGLGAVAEQDTAGWPEGRYLADRDARQPVVGGVRQRQHEPGAERGADPAREYGAVAGQHHPHPDGPSLAHEAADSLERAPVLDVLEGDLEAIPAVDEQDDPRQPVVGSGASALVFQRT
jgi:hypothetical protein